MATYNYKQLRTDARNAVTSFGKTAVKLIVIHTGFSVGANFMLALINYLLEMGIAQTGGLAGIGPRAILETVQQILQTTLTLALPFWSMGYTFAALQMSRGKSADSVNLLTGFRHLGPVLRTNILRGVVYFALMMLGAQIACYIFMLTPAAKELIAVMEQILASMENPEQLDYLVLLESEAYMQAMLPAMPFMLVGALVPLIPFLYRMRMMDFALMDDPRKGAFHAFGQSMRMTRKNCLAIFKLDLHFWWYYLLQALTVALLYGDMLLPMLGVELNMQADAAMYLFYGVALICEFGLFVWKKNQVTVTYALLYDQLRKPRFQPQAEKPAPNKVPWET